MGESRPLSSKEFQRVISESDIPFPPKHFKKIKIKNRDILLDRETTNWVVVNKSGSEFVEACDGERTISEIARLIATKSRCNINNVLQDALDFFERMRYAHFVSINELDRSIDRLRKVKEGAEPVTYFAILKVTKACNLACVHCSANAGIKPSENELNTNEWKDVIDDLATSGCTYVVFSGGEPLLRKDLLELASYARMRGIARIELATNGTLVSEPIAEELKKHDIIVAVSLDSHSPRTHDKIRGIRGSFEKTMRGIRNLKRAGIDPVVRMTAMKENVGQLRAWYNFVRDKVNPSEYTITSVLPWGRATRSGVLVSAESIYKSIHNLIEETTGNIVAACKFDGIVQPRLFRNCGIGSRMVINANGDVFPCLGASSEGYFLADNVRKRSVNEIWSSESFSRLRLLTVDDVQLCKQCDLKYICRGGCKVETFKYYGDLTKRYPRCNIMKKLILEEIKSLVSSMVERNEPCRKDS